MLAICSDLDESPSARSYFELLRFLNTDSETPMGRGVNLEVGNTMYFNMPEGHFSYWNASVDERVYIRELIKSGHIDCIHSFGDKATHRRYAEKALGELVKHDCKIKVWIDHAQATTNLGGDIMQGTGDLRGHDAYHSDLLMDYGIDYVWRGRVSSVIGQDKPFSLRGIYNNHHPFTSLKTMGKELIKHLCGRLGSAKYALHARNQILTPCQLRDGSPTLEFLRCNPHWGGVSSCDTGIGLGEVLNETFLNRLSQRNTFCILYTHMGKLASGTESFPEKTVKAFRLLKKYSDKNCILVTTTFRLLQYNERLKHLHCSVSGFPQSTLVELTSERDCPEGLSIRVNTTKRVEIRFNSNDVTHQFTQMPEKDGTVSFNFPWIPLAFPAN